MQNNKLSLLCDQVLIVSLLSVYVHSLGKIQKSYSYSYSDITLCFNFRSSFILIWISISRLSFPIYAMWNIILHKSFITFLTKMWESIALSEVLLSPWCFKCLDSDLGLDLTFPWLSGQSLICLFYCFSTKNSFQMWYTYVCVCVCACVCVCIFSMRCMYISHFFCEKYEWYLYLAHLSCITGFDIR